MSYCPDCGSQYEGHPKFCAGCGRSFEEVPSRPRLTLPGRLKPWHVLLALLGVTVLIVGGLVMRSVLGFVVRQVQSSVDDSGGESEVSQQDAQREARAEGEYLARGLQFINLTRLKDMVSTLSRSYGQPHVSVMRARDYPDEVLVTVAWPTRVAYQVVINPDSPPDTPDAVKLEKVDPDNLDSSVTEWNGSLDPNGNLVLKGFEAESVPDASTGPTHD